MRPWGGCDPSSILGTPTEESILAFMCVQTIVGV